MRVVHISTAHSPLDVRIFEKECVSLAKAGYTVTYLVPNVKQEQIKNVFFQNLQKCESSVRIFRILGRLYNTYRAAIKLKGNIYHIHDPELIPIGIILKLKGGIIIYDAHEDAPVEAISLNKNRKFYGKLLSLIWSIYLKFAKIMFDGFVTATPTIALGFPSKKTVIVRNYPILDYFKPYQKKSKENVLVYVGTISEIRGIKQILDAVNLVSHQLNIKLILAGKFVSKDLHQQLLNHPGWSKVDYYGEKPWEDVISLLQNASMGLLTLHPTPEYLVSLPIKLFEYMASGLPVIASDFPLWRQIIETSGHCGILVDPLSPRGIADAVEYLISNKAYAEEMGRAGYQAVHKHYSWVNEEDGLFKLYKSVLSQSRII